MENKGWRPAVGERVLIKKGARVMSLDPSWWQSEVRFSCRRYVVVIHRVSPFLLHSPPAVEWSGSSGYLKWCPLEDVEPCPTPMEQLAALGRKR